MRYGTKADTIANPCMECGVHCRPPKRFCSDAHKELWLAGRGIVIDSRGVAHVAQERERLHITPEALEWKRKLDAQRPF